MKVSKHLANTTGQNVVIKPSDYICLTCYRTQLFHHRIFNHPTWQQHSTTTVNRRWVSSKYNDNITDKLTKAILEALYVAHNLLMEKAILL